MARDPEVTRRSLVDAAARLFAARGIAAVSLNEINAAAGQRNASALQYHFGSRAGLLVAILDRHIPGLGERRRALLALADTRPGLVRPAAEAFVLPLAELLDGDWQGRAFLRIAAELRTDPRRHPAEVRELLDATAAVDAYDRMWPHGPALTPALRAERMRVGGMMAVHAIADRARLMDDAGDDGSGDAAADVPSGLFAANLVDMFVAATLAPVGLSSA